VLKIPGSCSGGLREQFILVENESIHSSAERLYKTGSTLVAGVPHDAGAPADRATSYATPVSSVVQLDILC
jgi:hypothetical protein